MSSQQQQRDNNRVAPIKLEQGKTGDTGGHLERHDSIDSFDRQVEHVDQQVMRRRPRIVADEIMQTGGPPGVDNS